MTTYRSDEPNFMKEVENMFKEDEPQKKQVDWEKLCHNLQEALTTEIANNRDLEQKINRLNGIELHVKNLENEIKKLNNNLMKQLGVITYLENKIGYDTV